jgi:serine/threonine protein kinase/ABC-type phosphate/phosphonate transport system substrate-binding protein
MTETGQCPQCGAAIPANARLGHCPACLLGLGTQPTVGSTLHDGADFSAAGHRFADYELGERIGEGGMGVVYKAVQISLRRPVALKMIRDAKAHSPEARRRFAIEAEAAAKLDHPNIVPIYAVGEHDEQPFLSMKFVAGENLRARIARGDLCVAGPNGDPSASSLRSREAAVGGLMAALARAVHHAHQHGVLHRDLKPGNIIVDADGQPHLTDFGLAKILDQVKSDGLTGPDNVIGTPTYMSPEQASGQRVTAASDIYSLGAIFYEMLTGHPAFKGATPLETIRMVAEKDVRRPSAIHHRIDRDLETICLKCLEKSPASRYPTASALADDLDRWSRREPIKARTAGPMLRLSRWVRRNTVGTALIISLLFGLGASLMLLKVAVDQRAESDLQVAAVNRDLQEDVQRLWEDEGQSYVHISASQLATLAGLSPKPIGPGTLRLIFAKRITQEPVGQAIALAPILRRVEERMAKTLGSDVAFDLRLYKLTGGAVQRPVAEGKVDFQRMGPVAYLRAEQAGVGLTPIVHELCDKEAVIFARKDSGIHNLPKVVGHSVAFGHTNSPLSCLAKYHLATNGIVPATLRSFANIERMDSPHAQGTGDSDYHAHKEVLKKVQAGEFDVGVVQRRHFESNRHRGRGLVELHSYKVPPDVLVAKPGLAANVIAAFRNALVSLKSDDDVALLEQIESPQVTGFVAITNGYFDSLRYALTNLVVQFDTPRAIPEAAQQLK